MKTVYDTLVDDQIAVFSITRYVECCNGFNRESMPSSPIIVYANYEEYSKKHIHTSHYQMEEESEGDYKFISINKIKQNEISKLPKGNIISLDEIYCENYRSAAYGSKHIDRTYIIVSKNKKLISKLEKEAKESLKEAKEKQERIEKEESSDEEEDDD